MRPALKWEFFSSELFSEIRLVELQVVNRFKIPGGYRLHIQ
jgi:hypothetical protein